MKIKYELENIIDDKSVTTPSEIVKKIDDFLTKYKLEISIRFVWYR